MIARALKLMGSLCAALAVLALGAAAGGAFAPARAAPARPVRIGDEQRYENQPAAGEIEVGDALRVNGQPMQLSVFFTPDAPGRVVMFYAEAFRARGLTPVLGAGHVSAFDPRDGWQRFITALEQPGGQTLVMVGAANPRRPPRLLNAAERAGFPVPAENRGFLGYSSDDSGARAETGQFMSALAPAQVASFYRKELLQKGWTERTSGSAEGLIAFVRGSEILSVALQALDDDHGAAVFVTRTTGAAQ